MEIGTYVQNLGFFQSWVGRIVNTNGDSYMVRITFSTGKYKEQWPVGSEVWLCYDEFKEVKNQSLNAFFHGALRK